MSDVIPTQDEMIKIIRINAYIQRGLGKVTLDGQEVVCVALDKTCATEDAPEIALTDEQLDDLFIQSFGYTKNDKKASSNAGT